MPDATVPRDDKSDADGFWKAVRRVAQRAATPEPSLVEAARRTAARESDSTDESSPEDPPEVKTRKSIGTLVVNQTNYKLELKASDGSEFLVIPPLRGRESKQPPEVLKTVYPLDAAENRNYLRVEEKTIALTAFDWVIWAFYAILGFLIYGFAYGTGLYWAIGLPAAAVGLVIAVFLSKSDRRRQLKKAMKETVPLRLAEIGVLVLVVGAAVGIPAAAVYFAGDIHAAFSDGGTSGNRHLVGSGALLLFLAALSGIPALLYFSFDRTRLETLRGKFVDQVFRFDPSVETLVDIDAKYGDVMNEAYGRETLTGRVLPGKRLPVVFATAALALGWLLAMRIPGLGSVPESTSFHVLRYLQVEQDPVAFAFLGAYFFALNLVFRGYIRGDLRPKSYTQITVRVLISLVLGFVIKLELPDTNKAALALAFVGGILPDTVLVWLRDLLRKGIGLVLSEPLEDTLPLTELEGIDLYDRARLLDEGVTNIEGLAHHDLIDLMLKTRIPVPRLFDWVDQSILYLHLGVLDGGGEQGQAPTSASAPSLEPEEPVDPRRTLRRYGIRTATDLVSLAEPEELARYALDVPRHPSSDPWDRRPFEQSAVLGLLPPAGADGKPPLVFVLEAVKHEEWIRTLLRWRARGDLQTRTCRFDGHTLVDVTSSSGPAALREKPPAASAAVPAPAG